jgi:sulfate adenylyltransferase subunit 1 (EFTu-like GTPase family)
MIPHIVDKGSLKVQGHGFDFGVEVVKFSVRKKVVNDIYRCISSSGSPIYLDSVAAVVVAGGAILGSSGSSHQNYGFIVFFGGSLVEKQHLKPAEKSEVATSRQFDGMDIALGTSW